MIQTEAEKNLEEQEKKVDRDFKLRQRKSYICQVAQAVRNFGDFDKTNPYWVDPIQTKEDYFILNYDNQELKLSYLDNGIINQIDSFLRKNEIYCNNLYSQLNKLDWKKRI